MIQHKNRLSRAMVRCLLLLGLITVFVQCGKNEKKPSLKERYHLSDAEAAAWDRLYVAEAESIAAEFWGYLGRGEFDQAKLMIVRYDDDRMTRDFEQRISRLWAPMVNWPADQLLKEPQIALGEGRTVGFDTWGELWTGGFQRAVLCDDSISVYFVFKGYWQTEAMPVYAAVGCGDFGKGTPQWRPFPYMVFSIDESEATKRARGQGRTSRTLDEFMAFLRTRTYGTFGT